MNRVRFHSVSCRDIWYETAISVAFSMEADQIQRYEFANPGFPQQLREVENNELLNWCKSVGYMVYVPGPV